MTDLLNVKKVKLKATHKLKRFARFLGGDMSETVHYFIDMVTGEPMESNKEPNKSFMAKGFHVCDHEEEFLVVDHPNPISRDEYNKIKELFEELPEERESRKGVF